MSYNIVKKGGSTVLVHKFRDGKKISEKYLLSLGVHEDVQHKYIQKTVHDLAQEDRIEWCQKSGMVTEIPKDTPRRKAPTGDIREQPVKKERKPRSKKAVDEKEKEPRVMWETRPYLKAGHLKREEASRPKEVKPFKVSTMSKAQVDNRISKIKEDIKFAKKVIAHKKNVQTFSASQQAGVRKDIDYYQSVITSGTKAISILNAQKAR